MPFPRWDVVVVGAGPAGALTAALLARAGKQVALIDAAHFPRQKVCGEYLSAAAWRLLAEERLGIDRSDGVPLTAMALTVPSGRSVRVAFDEDAARRPAAVSREILDARLVAAAQRAGAVFFAGMRVRGVRSSRGRVQGVSAVDVADPQRQLELDAPLVVAADGRRSRVVQDTGSFILRKSDLVGFKRHAPVADFARFAKTIAMHAGAGGYIGVCPVGTGVVNVCGIVPKHLLQREHGRIEKVLQTWLGTDSPLAPLVQSAATSSDSWHTMPEAALQRGRHRTPGALYVGDAMGTIEPLTGQGMTMALFGARLAVEHILNADGRVVDGAVQQAYERAWSRSFSPAIAAATWFGRILSHPRLLTAMMIGSAGLPGLGGFLVRRAHRRTLTAQA